MVWPAVVVASATVGLVGPLAVGATTFEQRAALAVVLVAVVGMGARAIGAPRLGLARSAFLLVACVVALAATAPVALRSERIARAAIEERAGERLMALGLAERAAARFEAADRLAPGSA